MGAAHIVHQVLDGLCPAVPGNVPALYGALIKSAGRGIQTFGNDLILIPGQNAHKRSTGVGVMQILYQVFNGVRPAMPDNLPAPYRELIQACWQRDAEHRPTFVEV